MKKLSRLMSAVLALVMVLTAMPILTSAAEINVSSGVIDFAGEADRETETKDTQNYGKYIYFDYEKNNFRIKDETMYIPWYNNASQANGRVNSFYIKGSGLTGTEKYGVYTYKFKYKFAITPTNATTIMFSDVANYDASTRLTFMTLSKAGIVFNGVTTSIDQTNWVDMEIKADSYRGMVGFRINGGEWSWRTITKEGNVTLNSTHMTHIIFRGSMTNGCDMYLDDISVSYTNVPVGKDLEKTLDFEDGTTGDLTKPWGEQTILEVADDPKFVDDTTIETDKASKVLKMTANADKKAAIAHFSVGGWNTSSNTGVLTYELDVYPNGNELYLRAGHQDGTHILNTRSLIKASNEEITSTTAYTTIGSYGTAVYKYSPYDEWRNLKIEYDFGAKTVATYLNGELVSKAAMPGPDDTNTITHAQYFLLSMRTSALATAGESCVYVDNLKATYTEKGNIPTIEAGAPAITGVTTVDDFKNAASLEVSAQVTNGYVDSENVTYIVGIYNGEVLVDCAVAEAAAAGLQTAAATATIDDVSFKADKTYDNIKIFVWDSLTGLKPLGAIGTIAE